MKVGVLRSNRCRQATNLRQGLNVEQRKKLTIGVELAAKPQLLLFLDEPTSGLDSDTSYVLLRLLRKLTDHGQAILCTIHQPSSTLFQEFDRLLFLGMEGKPLYFGHIGQGACTLINYFERNGATPCPAQANPAEWMFEGVGCAPGHATLKDWAQVWRESPEWTEVRRTLDELTLQFQDVAAPLRLEQASEYKEFAAPFSRQVWSCLIRMSVHHWRSPSYIYSKIALCGLTVSQPHYIHAYWRHAKHVVQALFLGFSSYKSENSLQGLTNIVFNLFIML